MKQVNRSHIHIFLMASMTYHSPTCFFLKDEFYLNKKFSKKKTQSNIYHIIQI